MTLRVLLLSYAFPPLAAPEAWLAAKAVHSLAHVGDEVEVVCARPRWWHSIDDSLSPWAHGAASEVHVVETPRWLPIVQPLAALRQFPDPMRLLQRRTLAAIRRIGIDRFDAIVTWSQWHSAHLVGLEIKRANPGLRWLAHLSDPWVDNPLQPRHALARRANARWERDVFSNADVVEFTSPETLVDATERVPGLATRATVVPHTFDDDLYSGRPPVGGPLIVRYVGSFYGARTPAPLLAGLERLTDRRDLRVELVGHLPASMMKGATEWKALPPGLVVARGSVGYLQSLREMREADVLVLIDAPAARNVFVASKLVDYLGARRPIVAITPPGAAADLVLEIGGWVADPIDSEAVAGALSGALAQVRANRGDDWGHHPATLSFDVRNVGGRRHDLLRPSPPAASRGPRRRGDDP